MRKDWSETAWQDDTPVDGEGGTPTHHELLGMANVGIFSPLVWLEDLPSLPCSEDLPFCGGGGGVSLLLSDDELSVELLCPAVILVFDFDGVPMAAAELAR